MGDRESHFNANSQYSLVTYDISNGSVLLNHGTDGTLRALTTFRDTYRSCCHTRGWQGVWLAKDCSSHGPYSYTVNLGDEKIDLSDTDWDLTTGLLDNIFPITRFEHPRGVCEITLLSFTPTSADGARRPRGAVYGLHIRNTSSSILEGSVSPPAPFPENAPTPDLEKVNWAIFDPYGYEFEDADSKEFSWTREFSLAPGETLWIPTILYAASSDAAKVIQSDGSLAWLGRTWEYHRRFLGRLEVKSRPILTEFFERQSLQALHCIGLSENGAMAGSNWGTYPATRQIWIKDTFYSCLPVVRHDPLYAKKIIRWFHQFGIRHEGTVVTGGIFHSVSVTVASIIFGGIYYRATADDRFFIEHTAMYEDWGRLLEAIIDGRESSEVWIVPTEFISDGKVECDRHTGSNVCVWRALLDFARIAEKVFGDNERATRMRACAERIAESILRVTIVDGVFGKQYVEGTNIDGSVPHMESDGEESETTLMPYYGWCSYDDPIYINTMKFSHSEENELYNPDLRAIGWKGVPSTAPGYAKALATGRDDELFYDHGAFREIRKVTEADGSVWWWSYGGASEEVAYGRVVRGIPGKSGWFAGVYSAIFVSRFLGLSYDAPDTLLTFRPLDAIGAFSWSELTLGYDLFSVSYEPRSDSNSVEVEVANANAHGIECLIEFAEPEVVGALRVEVCGEGYADFVTGSYCGKKTVIIETTIDAKSSIRIEATGS